jgi:hypothetical protein
MLRAMLHAGIVAVHAILVPYHLATEVHLHGAGPPSRLATSGERQPPLAHFCARHGGGGGGEGHTPHAAADHDREGTRPEGSDRTVAVAADFVRPVEVVVPATADCTGLADPGPLIPLEGTRPGPRRIRGPPPAPTPLPS